MEVVPLQPAVNRNDPRWCVQSTFIRQKESENFININIESWICDVWIKGNKSSGCGRLLEVRQQVLDFCL